MAKNARHNKNFILLGDLLQNINHVMTHHHCGDIPGLTRQLSLLGDFPTRPLAARFGQQTPRAWGPRAANAERAARQLLMPRGMSTTATANPLAPDVDGFRDEQAGPGCSSPWSEPTVVRKSNLTKCIVNSVP